MACDCCPTSPCSNPQTKNKKAIVVRTPDFSVPAPTVDLFNPSRFEKAIFDKGYEVDHEQAMRCACANGVTSQASVNCKNCGGAGWVFINKVQTKMLLSSMGNRKKYDKPWTETSEGIVDISASSLDKLGYMDRITLRCAEAYHSQSIALRNYQGNSFAFLAYFPLKIENAYLFISTDEPLKLLHQDIDFKLVDNRLILDPILYPPTIASSYEGYTLSIRYKHLPQYYITEILRDIMQTPVKSAGNSATSTLESLPQHARGMRAHYIFDASKFNGDELFDNSDYGLTESSCKP